MTSEEINIAIAEVLFDDFKRHRGLTLHQRTDDSILYGGYSSKGLWIWMDSKGLPYGMNYDTREACEVGEIKEMAKRNDWTKDLNAMHEAEKVILKDHSLHSGDTSVSSQYLRSISPVASAAQRAEAFLKTLGKWK